MGEVLDSQSITSCLGSRGSNSQGTLLHSVSFSYPQVDETVRAELASRLVARTNPSDAFVLTTCLRSEIVVDGGQDDLDRTIKSLLGDIPEATVGKTRSGEEAAVHLFRVAAGLESPIIGEMEILTQFRQTLKRTLESGEISGLFEGLLTNAVSVGRQARKLLPENPHDSMAAVAVQAIGSVVRVAVFGSGVMATSVVRALQILPAPPEVTVVARRPDTVEFDNVGVWSFDRAPEALASFPVVISATSAKKRLVPDQAMFDVVAKRAEPLVLVDMAMPPDFRPGENPNLTYVNIDDLARMADRRPRSEAADEFVADAAVAAYRRYDNNPSVGSVISEMMEFADRVVSETVERFAGRLQNPDDDEVLRQTAHTVARTLLARPVEAAKRGDRDDLEALSKAFPFNRE